MRLVAFVSLIAAIGALSCQQQYLRQQKPQSSVSFQTPSGDISEGDSMTKVIAIIGNPHQVEPQGRFELWQYNLDNERKMYVVFEKGSLYWVKFEQ